MTELPPIIERLDHALEMWHKRLQSGDDMQAFWEIAIAQMAPELRAELLRLQAERDDACQERDAKDERCRELSECMDDNADLAEHYKAERDALLEALKKARGKLIDASTHSGDEARRMVNDAESIMWSAIDNVEGKDG